MNLSTLISMVRMLPLDRVSSSNTKGRSTREQVAEEMQTLMRHRTVDKRGCATLLALGDGGGRMFECRQSGSEVVGGAVRGECGGEVAVG